MNIEVKFFNFGRYGQALVALAKDRKPKIVQIEVSKKTLGIRTVIASEHLTELVEERIRRS